MKTEVDIKKSEDRRPKTEVDIKKSEDRRPKIAIYFYFKSNPLSLGKGWG